MHLTKAVRPAPLLVGREAEIDLLTGVLDGLVAGRGGIVAITGEPGIGKSRLVGEAQQRFGDQVRFLVGHAVSYAETIAYWPVREFLRSWLDVGVSDPEARVRLELRAALASALPDDDKEAYPFLAALLGVALEPADEQRMHEYARDSVQRQTYDWLYELVSALTRERPLCLVLDDLHWSDEATLSLIEELLPAAEQVPVAFVLIHRSDPDHSAWQLIDRAHRRFRGLFYDLELQPLPAPDSEALAEATAGAALPQELVQLLAEQAGGNPYFVGEAIRDLLERGALERDDGRLVLVGEASIPVALRQTLQARLDRLDTKARAVVATASVIGRTFGLPLLERLLPSGRLLPTLSELQWLNLVVQERGGASPEYRFQHGLVQEVAYGALLEPTRRELHRAVGEALLDLHRDSPAEVHGLLGRHFAEAEEPERAVEYLLKAADAARAIYADEEAIELYRRALVFMDRAGDDPRARETLFKIALTHHLAFDFAAANAAFGEAFEHAAPEPSTMSPSERITWALPAAWDRLVAPGHSYTKPAWEIGVSVFRGLLAVRRDLDVEPDVAERFTVSDSGLSYRFTLRADACWSDGVPVTADDFAFTFDRMSADGLVTPLLEDAAVTATALDERTLELVLVEPRNDFLYLLALPSFFPWPRHVYERDGRDWHKTLPVVGNGPFVLTALDEDSALLEAAPRWHGARGNVAEVAIELVSSPVARGGWRQGRYDVLDDVLAIGAVADDDTVVERSPGLWTWYLGFVAGLAPLDDPRVRRAFAHAIDRDPVARSLRSASAGAGGLLPPAMPGHSHRVAPPFDPESSNRLLEEAGFSDRRALGEIALACLELWEEAATEVVAQLERSGVRVRLLAVPSDPDLARAIEQRTHGFIWAWNADSPDPGGFLSPVFNKYELALYRDARLEQLLTRAAALPDQDERLRTYRQFEQIWIGEQAAVVPLAYSDRALWRRPRVTGLWANAITMSSFADAVVTRPGA
jgi:ABC-type transport system substrate-binding protein